MKRITHAIGQSVLNLLERILWKGRAVPEAEKTIAQDVPDTALARYLQYYSTLEAPRYAVLVTGPWGVGKTHQVKEVIPKKERYFVSLYGLNSADEIHDAVLASCLPNLNANEFVSYLGEFGKAIGDKYAVGGFANNVWNVFLRQRLKPDRTIVFDDLERSPLWATQKNVLLGAINHYVEDRGFRVVAICHDEHIANKLAEIKEKTFGHTIQAVAQTGAAFDNFLADLSDEATSTFISANRPLIEEIWTESGQSSLRILKHVINDIGRLYKTLEQRHLVNQNAINQVLRFFCALDIEVHAGNLNRELLIDRMSRYISAQVGPKTTEDEQLFLDLISRYTTSNLTEQILSDDIVITTLIEGQFDSEVIAAWLDQTSYFIKAADTDPWLIVMKFDELDDDLLNLGIERMQSQFDKRTVTNMGEFLHIATLRLMMAEQNVSGRTLENETELCLGYIDDLLAENRLPPKSLADKFFERSFSAYGGYSYWVSDTAKPHFEAICKHIDHAESLALKATYPKQCAEILRKLEEEPSSVFKMISPTNHTENILAHIPVLAHISPRTFLNAWLSGPRNEWRTTTMALNNRYKLGRLEQELRDERPWLIDLENEMEARIKVSSGLDAYRLTRLKPTIFKEMVATAAD